MLAFLIKKLYWILDIYHFLEIFILLDGPTHHPFLLLKIGAGFDDEKSLLMSQMSLEKRFGQSAVFVASTLMENGGVPQSATPENLLKEAIHVISCGYEDKSEWGSEVCCRHIFNSVVSFLLSV